MWLPLQVINEDEDILDVLRESWPTEALAANLVTIVGLGSIGAAAAEALAGYGIRRLALVDPDRLEQRNLARHKMEGRHVGRLKVHVVKERLLKRDKKLDVETFPIDVIDRADVMRPLFAKSAVIIGCTDGVASRRVLSHLGKRAHIPVVLVCVLEDGAIGEVLRLRPWGMGCLACHRETLVAEGRMDPEPGIDLGYGTGSRHRPMTAVGGDLWLVGEFAAKVALATLLEASGDWGQRLPGDHAVLALRPKPGIAEPYDLERPGLIRWEDMCPPRIDCPTCNVAG